MAISNLTAVNTDIEVLSSEFRSFTSKSGDEVSFYQVIAIVGPDEDLIVLNTLKPEAANFVAGETYSVKIAHSGYSNVRLPKFKLVELVIGE